MTVLPLGDRDLLNVLAALTFLLLGLIGLSYFIIVVYEDITGRWVKRRRR